MLRDDVVNHAIARQQHLKVTAAASEHNLMPSKHLLTTQINSGMNITISKPTVIG
jgi:hypothetical protein